MWSDPVLTLMFLLVVPVVYTLTRKFGKRVRRASKYSMRANSIIIREVDEAIEGMVVLRTHNAEGRGRRRFNAALREHFRLVLTGRKARALTAPVVEFVTLMGAMGVALAAAWYVFVQKQSDPADAVIVLVWLALAGASFKPLSKLNNSLQEAGAAAKRIDELLAMPIEQDADGATTLPEHREQITFEQGLFQLSQHRPARAAQTLAHHPPRPKPSPSSVPTARVNPPSSTSSHESPTLPKAKS